MSRARQKEAQLKEAQPRPSGRRWSKLAGVVALAAVATGLILAHSDLINGPWYWKWAWQRLDAAEIYLPMLVAMLPLLIGQLVFKPGHRDRTIYALGLVLVTSLGLMLAGIAAVSDEGLGHIVVRVTDIESTGYGVDAMRARQTPGWLASYPQLLPQLTPHGQTKPAGPVLYYYVMVALFGSLDNAALPAGLGIALLALGSVLATYLLLRHLLGDEDAAFAGASFLAVCPAFVLFFPSFDQVWPILSCAMVGTWSLALRRGRLRWAAAFGLVLALAIFGTYSLLVMGTFLLGLTAIHVWQQPVKGLVLVARQAAIALAVLVVAYLMLWLITGYNARSAFSVSLDQQAAMARRWAVFGRRYPWTVPFDLTDFLLGAGWVGGLLACYYFFGRWRQPEPHQPAVAPPRRAIALLCVVQLLIVAVTGVLPTETARVWLFMLPLLMVPVGLELAQWNRWARLGVFAAIWLVTAAVAQNMALIVP